MIVDKHKGRIQVQSQVGKAPPSASALRPVMTNKIGILLADDEAAGYKSVNG